MSDDIASITIARELFSRLSTARHVGIVGHKDPDGDSLGSMLALGRYCETLGIAYTPFCIGEGREKWSFLPGSFRLQFDLDFLSAARPVDVLVVCDTPDLRYAGLADWFDSLEVKPFVFNIDHHHDNERYGDVNHVVGDAPATTQILYKLFGEAGIAVDADMATCLLCGILVDTNHFSNAATTEESMQIAAELVSKGAHMQKMVRRLWQQQYVSTFPVWGKMLARLSRHTEHDIVSTIVPHHELSEIEHESEGMANFLNSIGEGKCALIVKEVEPGVIKGSFRTTRDDVDVSRLARILGGGGHQKAAGFTLQGSLQEQENGWIVA